MVIATGGGTPCFYNNMEFMNNHGITLYLKLDIPSLVFRLQHDAAVRPLIQGMSPEQLKTFVHQHLEERKEFYEESQIEVNGLGMSNKKIEDLVYQIANYSR
ncbi:MAG: shikimate kinase [Litorivivens sp.]|jgi:shikimate kinase